MRNFKTRVIALFFLWGLFIGGGHVLTIADNRFYQVISFIVAVVIIFYGDTLWNRRKKKKVEEPIEEE